MKPTTATGPLLTKVAGYYRKTLNDSPKVLASLKEKGLSDPAVRERFQLGYSNETLHRMLPKKGAIMDGLMELGVLHADGSEALKGCLVVPLFDLSGQIVNLCGWDLSQGSYHYLPKQPLGVFNGQGARHENGLILVKTVIEAMALWQRGFQNGVALHQSDNWQPEHDQLVKEHEISTLYSCLDGEGNAAFSALKAKTASLPITLRRVRWPSEATGVEAFFKNAPEPSDFEALIQSADTGEDAPASTNQPLLAKEEPLPDGIAVIVGERRYELRGLEKPNAGQLKATIKAFEPSEKGRFHIDTFNLYQGRARRSFVQETARLFGEPEDSIVRDVNQLIERSEDALREAKHHHRETPASQQTAPVLSEAEEEIGRSFGQEEDLVGNIRQDLEKLGVLGENPNKLTAYLTMSSRKMDDPLSLQILSVSGAGKSHLQDSVLKLCPPEDLIKLTALSNQALFYSGRDALKHKVLALEEDAGAKGASYAVRSLISSKKLTIESTGRNPVTGELEAQICTVQGPTAVFETTTNPESDPETKSRFIILNVDESAAQTERILEAQRSAHTLAGLRFRKEREGIIQRHQSFQRLLQPVTVVNPFEPLLGFRDDRLLSRRDQPKYLHLILAITFLHQMQRPWKTDPEIGPYIESTLEDIAIANQLAHLHFGHSLNELNGPSRDLLRHITAYVNAKATAESILPSEVLFIRRELRERIGWSEYQLRAHLKQLEDLEYIQATGGRQGQLFRYRLIYFEASKEEQFCAGIKPVEQIRAEAEDLGLLESEPLRGARENFEGESSRKEALRATSLTPKPEVELPLNGLSKRIAAKPLPTSSRINGSKTPQFVAHA